MCGQSTKNKISQYQDNDIKTLSERLESLKIMNEALGRIIEYTDNMSVAPVPMQESKGQAGVPKNMVPNPEWFNGDRMKFEDWWRGI